LNTVGIVSALAAEARRLGPAIRLRGPLCRLADGSLLVVSGVGCTAAGHAAHALVDAGATALVSWGMAGALDPALCPGSIVLPSEVVGPDGATVATARAWCERLATALASRRPVLHRKLLTTPRVIASVCAKSAIFRESGAAAVDMESLAIGEVAREHALPFIAVRVIVDTARDVVPRCVVAAMHGGGPLRVARLLGALVLAPADIAALWRLAHRYRAARRALDAVAAAGSLVTCAAAGAPHGVA
jgi:adenosylhomocysteine nucleosidase